MKKIITLLLILCFVLLIGCTPKETLTTQNDYLLLRVGDEVALLVESTAEEVVLLYKTKDPIVSVDKDGTLKALAEGTTIITVFAKQHASITITIEVIANDGLQLKVYFVDVGQADAMIAILPNNEVLMIDAGLDHYSIMSEGNYPSWENIVDVMEKENITTIDHLIITHNHADHYYFIPDILENYEVKNIYGSGSTRTNFQFMSIMQAIDDAGLTLQIVQVYDKIIDEPHLTLQVVAAKRVLYESNEEVNHSSVVTKLTYRNRAFLLTGDAGSAEGDGERMAMQSGINLQSDVLKVGHHGSYASSSMAFLSAVKPKYAVITTANQTQTGHPHDTTLRRLGLISAEVLESRHHGTILFITDGFDLQYETQK